MINTSEDILFRFNGEYKRFIYLHICKKMNLLHWIMHVNQILVGEPFQIRHNGRAINEMPEERP